MEIKGIEPYPIENREIEETEKQEKIEPNTEIPPVDNKEDQEPPRVVDLFA
ncbi:MAG: hypothetical protein JW969_16615 [Spirochaetales bacterium]|nr:hypothetical protein [Spirochaetales bacterium]